MYRIFNVINSVACTDTFPLPPFLPFSCPSESSTRIIRERLLPHEILNRLLLPRNRYKPFVWIPTRSRKTASSLQNRPCLYFLAKRIVTHVPIFPEESFVLNTERARNLEQKDPRNSYKRVFARYTGHVCQTLSNRRFCRVSRIAKLRVTEDRAFREWNVRESTISGLEHF